MRLNEERSGILALTHEHNELSITFHRRGDGHYTLTARSSLGTIPEHKEHKEHKFRSPLTHEELISLRNRLDDGTARMRRRVRRTGPEPVRDVGKRLFYALCEGPIGAHCQQLLAQARAPERRVRLRLLMDTPELARLPWEFLYDEQRSDFVGLSMHSPLIRQWGHQDALKLEPIVAPLRILVVTADVYSQLESKEEVVTLRRLQDKFSEICELDVVQNATRQDFFSALKEKSYHVLLFIGNGHKASTCQSVTSFGKAETQRAEQQTLALMPEEENGSGWQRTWELVQAEELIDILRDKTDLRLIHLNGPYTDCLARQLTTVAPATIGIRGAVTEPAYQAFSAGCYRALFSGFPLEAAVTQGRQKMDHHRAGTREWSHVVFYMQNEHGVLLPQAASQAAPIPFDPFDLQPAPIEPPAQLEQEEASKLLEMRLAIHKSNLEVLKERCAKYREAIPAFLRRQREETEDKIAQIEAEMRELGTKIL